MNIKVTIIEELRQLQLAMHRTAFHSHRQHSSYRGQGKVLGILRERPEIGRGELGELLNISRQSLSELLLKLEKGGYICRVPDANDRRRLVVKLTEEGEKAAQVVDVRTSPLPSLLDCLNDKELEQLRACLERILLHHQELYPELSPLGERNHAEDAQRPDGCGGSRCPGPENCAHDYLKYGHDRPNPAYCAYAHLFPFPNAPDADTTPPSVEKQD